VFLPTQTVKTVHTVQGTYQLISIHFQLTLIVGSVQLVSVCPIDRMCHVPHLLYVAVYSRVFGPGIRIPHLEFRLLEEARHPDSQLMAIRGQFSQHFHQEAERCLRHRWNISVCAV